MHMLLTAIMLLAGLPDGLSLDDTVKMKRGVEFVGLISPERVEIGETMTLEMYFKVKEPLGEDWWMFTHIEAKDEPFRRILADRKPPEPVNGIIHHHVELVIPKDVRTRRFEIYLGIWNRKTDKRLALTDPPSSDDRIHAGWVEMVKQGTSAPRTFSRSDMKIQKLWVMLKPWVWWILAVLITVAGSLLLRRWYRKEQLRTMGVGRYLYASIAVLFVPLLINILLALDFVKDDAYISFRYAHNLAFGEGLVFNPGDRLEGFTNFLWTLLMAVFEAMGADLFQVCEVLGIALCFGVLLVLTLCVVNFTGVRKSGSHTWAALWLAVSSSMGLWATSGMEQPLAMLLPLLSVLLWWRGRERDSSKFMAMSGLLMGLGCMTRPEIHLMGVIAGITVLGEAANKRRIDKPTIAWVTTVFAVILPFHLFRYLYYGSLLPNTFYVKTGEGVALMIAGLTKLNDMFFFNWTGALVVLVPLAFLDKRKLKEKLVVLAMALGFMLYIIKVGVDEMRWHRLYLPALPFLVMLAGVGLQNLVDMVHSLLKGKIRIAPVVVGWTLVLTAVAWNVKFTARNMGGFNGWGELSGTFHPDMGKFITRHERPGSLVAFQDMGSTPYHAPDIAFFDFIGLTERTVARARYAYGLNAYTATENYQNQSAFDAKMRDYFFTLNPEWTILTVYVDRTEIDRVKTAFNQNPGPEAMMGLQHNNGYQFRITKDPRFEKQYRHVRTWPRSDSYYLMLFRRVDLWEQVPGEVVLDRVPAGIGGQRASFERGLELLGSQMEHQAIKKHEAFITTWWKAPGPLEADIEFFIHAENPKSRFNLDHPPGDWMYPADRWKAGNIIEDRVLFQLPNGMRTGIYNVYIGVYRRSTGQRLAITSGTDDGNGRILLGTLKVTPLRYFIDYLIPPTDVEEQRKYPKRIIDPGRRKMFTRR